MNNRSGNGGTGGGGRGGQNGQGRGQGRGCGAGGQGRKFGGGQGMNTGNSDECVCPDCGQTVPHTRGTPCQQVACPACGTMMVRKF